VYSSVLRWTKRSPTMFLSSRIQRQKMQHPVKRLSSTSVPTWRVLCRHRKRRFQVYLCGGIWRPDMCAPDQLVHRSAVPERWPLRRATSTCSQPVPSGSSPPKKKEAKTPPSTPPSAPPPKGSSKREKRPTTEERASCGEPEMPGQEEDQDCRTCSVE